MTDMERRIIAAVDEQKDDLIAFFRELLQCRSFTGKEQEVAAKLIGGLRARGMEEVELVERRRKEKYTEKTVSVRNY